MANPQIGSSSYYDSYTQSGPSGKHSEYSSYSKSTTTETLPTQPTTYFRSSREYNRSPLQVTREGFSGTSGTQQQQQSYSSSQYRSSSRGGLNQSPSMMDRPLDSQDRDWQGQGSSYRGGQEWHREQRSMSSFGDRSGSGFGSHERGLGFLDRHGLHGHHNRGFHSSHNASSFNSSSNTRGLGLGRSHIPNNTYMSREVARADSPLFSDAGSAISRHSETGSIIARHSEVLEYADHFMITLEAPGMTSRDVHVQLMEDNTLKLSGEHAEQREVDVGSTHRIERNRGSFTKSFSLPANADIQNISAYIEGGVIHVRINKSMGQHRAIDIPVFSHA